MTRQEMAQDVSTDIFQGENRIAERAQHFFAELPNSIDVLVVDKRSAPDIARATFPVSSVTK